MTLTRRLAIGIPLTLGTLVVVDRLLALRGCESCLGAVGSAILAGAVGVGVAIAVELVSEMRAPFRAR
jgi:hypothetical protein